MKTFLQITAFLLLALSLSACGAQQVAQPEAAATLAGDMPDTGGAPAPSPESTPVPEMPSPDEAAAGCPQATDGTQVLRNEEHGYCLLYPEGYQVETPNEQERVLVVGGLLNVEDPRLHITVSPAEGRSVEQVADQVTADYSIPGMEIGRSVITLGGEPAIVLDNVPGQDINRRLVVVHEGRLYHLMFSPASQDAGAIYQRMEELYDLVTGSFSFLPQQ